MITIAKHVFGHASRLQCKLHSGIVNTPVAKYTCKIRMNSELSFL
jgi:hypothetical protein